MTLCHKSQNLTNEMGSINNDLYIRHESMEQVQASVLLALSCMAVRHGHSTHIKTDNFLPSTCIV